MQIHGNLAVAHAGMGAMRAALVSDERRRALAAQHDVGGVSQNYLELNAATLLMALGRYREALAFLERAQARPVPDQAMLQLRFATLMFHLGQHARALQHVAQCEAAPTVHPIIKLTAAILRVQVGAASQGRARLDESVLAQRRAGWPNRTAAMPPGCAVSWPAASSASRPRGWCMPSARSSAPAAATCTGCGWLA